MVAFLDLLVYGTSSCLFWLIWRYRQNAKRNPRNLPHPPGPRGLPIVGNIRDLQKPLPWVHLDRWSRENGSRFLRLNVLGKNILVINSLDVAVDIFEKRSSIYSDRDHWAMLHELCGFGWAIPFSPYGPEWRDKRKAFHLEFNPNVVQKWQPIEERAAQRLLKTLLQNPADLLQHVRYQTGSIVMKVAYDIDTQENDDPYIILAERVLHAVFLTTTAGAYLVDTFSFLKYLPEWFPGAKFKKDAKVWKAYADEMLNVPFNVVKNRIERGEIFECATTSLLQKLDGNLGTPASMEETIKATVGTIYGAGADTVMCVLGNFFLAMVLYPDVQLRAQQEIDSVLHGDRLPTFSDFSSLPYLEALVMEALRWIPAGPLSIPHRSTEDDEYAGYFIPKGTLVIGNMWAILHDKNAYPDPSTFNPDRFMKNGTINREIRDPRVGIFGFGRRMCPGRFMAFDSIWITVASVLAVYNIAKAKDEGGKPITPPIDYEWGFICYPKPFPCNITPRSAEHTALIQAVDMAE